MPADVFPILSPVSGRLCLPSTVPANAFSQNRLLGQGPIIEVTGNQLVAPASGRLIQASASGDFLVLKLNGGVELVMLLGNGDCFDHHSALKRHYRAADAVNAGDVLLTLNQALLRGREPEQRMLRLLVNTSAPLRWAQRGSVSALDKVIFYEDNELT